MSIVTFAALVNLGRTHASSRIEWLSRAAAIVLAVVLASLTISVVLTARVTREVADRVDLVRTLTDRLRSAEYSLAAEQSLERKYLLMPDGDTFVAHRSAARDLVAALTFVRGASDANGRRAVDEIVRLHRTYLDETRRLFIATNRNDAPRVASIESAVDPIFGEIDDDIGGLLRRQAVVADVAVRELRAGQARVIEFTIGLSVVGIGCLGCFLAIVGTYRAQVRASHRAELLRLENTMLLDALTGIGNHRAFKQDLIRELSRASRHDDPFVLALVDVDDFKLVNDRNGHLEGDRVLASVADLLSSLRVEDRAYRIGGDEFAVILPTTPLASARDVIARLQKSVRGSLAGTTLSIGIASSFGASDAETLQSQADAAMYAAKRAGKDQIAVFDASLEGMCLLSPQKVHALRELIAARTMAIAYQPIWDMQHCRILAYEALARPDASYGFSGPQEAFDLAERLGRVHELDAICREAALAQATNLPADSLLFVNMSPRSLDHERFDAESFASTVRAAGLTPGRVVIEITERSITLIAPVIAAALELQKFGFRLALDDTGAGNSGLEMLSRLPLEFVKIDRQIIVESLTDRKARGVLAGIVAIAKATDAYVIAEGIETTELLEFVSDATLQIPEPATGIQGVQGYLLRRPRETFLEPAETEDVLALLREYRPDRRSRYVRTTTPSCDLD